MTSTRESINLTVVAHEDVHLAIARLRDGWSDAYQKKAAVVRLSRADLEKLGLKDNARVELTSPAGSVVVTAKLDAAGDDGLGLMPSSLYTNRLASYEPGSSTLLGKHIQARVVPTEKVVTPLSDLLVRRNRA